MPLPDKNRNQEFEKDVEKGLSITQLAEKYRLSKRQISRLKKKLGLTSTPTSTKRMTFWLPVPVIEKIKKRAANQGKTASALLRDILDRHL